MIFLPLPFLTALLAVVACALVLRMDLGASLGQGFFSVFFGVCALASLLVGLRFGQGVDALFALQRVVPLFMGPLLYLGFFGLTTSDRRTRRHAACHLGLAMGLTLIPALPFGLAAFLDWAIGLSYMSYAGLLLLLWRRGPDALIRARLENVDRIPRWAAAAAAFLLALLLLDGFIAVQFALERREDAVAMISLASLAVIAFLILVITLLVAEPERRRAQRTPAGATESDAARLVAASDDLLLREQLFLDSGLTVERLAKRLHVPTRALSEAINHQQGINVSLYVNGFRLRQAARLLTETDISVAAVMERSGFLTRSNFYREFRRAYGLSPAAYRRQGSPPVKSESA